MATDEEMANLRERGREFRLGIRETIMCEDHGFESKYDGVCVICLTNYEPGSKIATAPHIYHRRNNRGSLLRFGNLRCVLDAREHPAAVYFGGAA